MTIKQIVFTGVRTAELLDADLPPLGPGDVLTRTEYSVISAGTERANLLAMNNTCGIHQEMPKFPRFLGYCAVGHVEAAGAAVTSVKPGDRALVCFGTHSSHTVMPEDKIVKIENGDIDTLEASFTVIGQMSLGGVRKARLEIGESAMVMGLGILGMFAVQLCRVNGAIPVVAADPNPERRRLALDLGADYAFDPLATDFCDRVRAVTRGKGVRAVIEVSGSATALPQALSCVSLMGRVVLLGCTRVSDSPVDFYKQVHSPGVQIIGAHTHMRPKAESYPHHWTCRDDCVALLDLLGAGRVAVNPVISEIHAPDDAPEVFRRLCDEPGFPIGVVFDWKRLRSQTCGKAAEWKQFYS